MLWADMNKTERVETVKKCLLRGLSMKGIAEELQAGSRNVIIGFCNRNKLTLGFREVADPKPSLSKPRAPKAKSPKPVVSSFNPIVLSPTFSPFKTDPLGKVHRPATPSDVTLFAARPLHCRNPAWDGPTPKPEAAFVCGEPVERGVYCGRCADRLYAKPAKSAA